ncbi:MAG: hypothetical protein ACOYY2_11190 [Actinomycetota bacterium]
MDLTECPDCGGLAEVEGREVTATAEGPLELVFVRCVRGHWFLLPAAALPGAA